MNLSSCKTRTKNCFVKFTKQFFMKIFNKLLTKNDFYVIINVVNETHKPKELPDMKDSLKQLVEDFYTEEQKELAEEIEGTEKDHILNYKILSLAFDRIEMPEENDLIQLFGVGQEETSWLTEVDYIIAGIIMKLDDSLDEDIKEGYHKSIVLDVTQPEFEYLTKKTREYLSK